MLRPTRTSCDRKRAPSRVHDPRASEVTLLSIFSKVFLGADSYMADESLDPLARAVGIANDASSTSAELASDGYVRTKLTSDLVGTFINGVTCKVDRNFPALSQAKLDVVTFKQVEVLKNFTYQSLIMSSMLKVARRRGKDIVTTIFKALNEKDGHLLMPDDIRALHLSFTEPDERQRVICDFIAGMTDRYAIQLLRPDARNQSGVDLLPVIVRDDPRQRSDAVF